MVLGTGSHVGKSLLTAALCRIFADAGVRVAPFKSQNMSLNSAATSEGLEIGRAQALQAEAARVPASVHMNPILLKPSGNMSSQVVVRGRIWGRLSAADYHLRRVAELLPLVRESYAILAGRHELIVLEGAGSPAEINLKQTDIVNLRMAEMAEAPCLLVGDIDRGGVFASLYGTVQLLEAHERERIAGFIVNKFRGDPELLAPGVRMIEDRIGKPCLGVLPWLPDLALDEEDSLGLPSLAETAWPADRSVDRPLCIAVVALPSLANFTDLDALGQEPSVHLRLCRTPAQLAGADLVLLPGSKQTADDLLWLREQRLAEAIGAHARAGGPVVGLCGGLQMLGSAILDPGGMERPGETAGLGLLPLLTRMRPDKVTRPMTGRLASPRLLGHPQPGLAVAGYEIHIGETVYAPGAQPFCTLADGSADGCVSDDGRIFGTYLHGLFDGDRFRHSLLAALRACCGLAPAEHLLCWQTRRGASLDRLAAAVRASLDLPRLFALAGFADRCPARHEEPLP